jgi:TRAP-type C4-dicarboxylate transport system permease small subunit
MTPHYVILSIFVIAGCVAVLASLFGWRWFLEAHNAHSIVGRVGITAARWIYGIIGVAMILLAIYFYNQLPTAG